MPTYDIFRFPELYKIEPKHIFFCVLIEVGGISFLETILFNEFAGGLCICIYIYILIFRYLFVSSIYIYIYIYIYVCVYTYINIYIYQFIIYRLVDPDPRCGLLTKSSFLNTRRRRVTLTDYDELVPLMERNIGHNNLEGTTTMERRKAMFNVRSKISSWWFQGLLNGLGRIELNHLPTCYYSRVGRGDWHFQQKARSLKRWWKAMCIPSRNLA